MSARFAGGWLGRVQALEPAQLGDDLGQAAALDELHGVERHAPLAADGVDRHDVGVVQAGGGLGLELEPLQLLGVQRRGQRQDLQRHPAVERELLGLVDDAHAAPADLAEDAEIAQGPIPSLGVRPWPQRSHAPTRARRITSRREKPGGSPRPARDSAGRIPRPPAARRGSAGRGTRR